MVLGFGEPVTLSYALSAYLAVSKRRRVEVGRRLMTYYIALEVYYGGFKRSCVISRYSVCSRERYDSLGSSRRAYQDVLISEAAKACQAEI